MKKIYFIYRTTEKPYGGVNSFNRALRNAMCHHPEMGLEVTDKIEEADLLFLSAASRGPDDKCRDRMVKPWQLRNLANRRWIWDPRGWSRKFAHDRVPLVHRLDGLTARYGRQNGTSYDSIQLRLNQFAERTIFQSSFCQESFRQGEIRLTDAIVLNGVDDALFPWASRSKPKFRWKAIAASWSSNPGKGHAEIALLSRLQDLDVTFIGRWPSTIDPQKVRLLPAMNQAQLVEHYHQSDFFVHLAQQDPSPNVVVEALSTGLPVLYLASGGTPELCGNSKYGVAMRDLSPTALDQGVLEMKTIWEELKDRVHHDRDRFLIETCLAGYAAVFKLIS